MDSPIKVLVVDDSLFMRKALSEIVESDPHLCVAGTAKDGADGLKKIVSLQPDVVLLDIDMPRMNGLSAIRHIMIRCPVPIVVFSSLFSLGDVTLEALELGVVDFIPKPSGMGCGNMQHIRQQIVDRIRIASTADVGKIRRVNLEPARLGNSLFGQSGQMPLESIIAVGAGFSGTNAVIRLVSQLPPTLPGALIAMIEISSAILPSFVENLNTRVSWNLLQAEDGQVLRPGTCYLGSNDRFINVTRNENNLPCLRIGGPTNRPLNTLFKSSAKIFNLNTIGVMLAGLGDDGADGFSFVQMYNGVTIVQKTNCNIAPNLTKNAVDQGVVNYAVDEDDIPQIIENALVVNAEYKVA